VTQNLAINYFTTN